MRKSINWTEKEDQLIIENFPIFKSKKWKIIANILKQNGFQKKQTQCRQRFINHLSPDLDKSKQISAELLSLFYKKYQQYGPKWTILQCFLPKISQVQLKNIFYGNIRCFIKKIVKYFTKKTAVFVNKFDTFTLQNIYSGKKNFKNLNCLKEDIKKLNYRFEEQQCLKLIKEREQQYKIFLKAVLKQEVAKKSKNYEDGLKNYVQILITIQNTNPKQSITQQKIKNTELEQQKQKQSQKEGQKQEQVALLRIQEQLQCQSIYQLLNQNETQQYQYIANLSQIPTSVFQFYQNPYCIYNENYFSYSTFPLYQQNNHFAIYQF